MKRHQINRFKKKKLISLVVDGECEFWYFAMMIRNETNLQITLKPKLPQRKKLVDQFNEVKDSSNHFDKVFWIIDFDKLIEEDRAKPKGSKSPIQEFKEYQERLNKIENIIILINNPCLEFWFLLHFEKTGKFFNNCETATKQLLKHLPDYDKSQKYYTKDDDIYKRLKENQLNAISNAKALKNFDIGDPNSAAAEMFNLFYGKNKLI